MPQGDDDAPVEGANGAVVEPWFTGRPNVNVLLYRVNRRPYPQGNLLAQDLPDVFDHVVEVLLFGERVETGRAHKRTWVLGNREIDTERRTLSGEIGYSSEGQHTADEYDDETREWHSGVAPTENTARAPFVFDAESRVLGVLQAPGFTPKVVPDVLRILLNRGEQARDVATTDWDVEPLLDETAFLQWLREADAVEKLIFVAKLPNPTGREEFAPVWDRLEARRAKVIREEMEARNPDEGLQGIEEDRQARAYMAMAGDGYGWIRGTRRHNGKTQTYDQRNRIKKERLTKLPATWTGARNRLRALVKGLPEGSERDATGT